MITGKTMHGEKAVEHLKLNGWKRERVIDRGFTSLAQLWNSCAAQCEDSDCVVIMSEAARPTRRQLELFFGLFQQGYFLVLGKGVNCFGIQKQLLRELGPFDESCGLADMIFRMWQNNYAISDMGIVPVLKAIPQYESGIWGTPSEKKQTLKKWDTRKEVCSKDLEDTCERVYDWGPSPKEMATRLTWDFSRFDINTQFFKDVLPFENLATRDHRLPELAILRAHREFIPK